MTNEPPDASGAVPAPVPEIFEHTGILPHAESPGEFCRKLERFLDSLDTDDADLFRGEL